MNQSRPLNQMSKAIKANILKHPLATGLFLFLMGQAAVVGAAAFSDHTRLATVEREVSHQATHQDIEQLNRRMDDLREIMLSFRDRR